MMIDCVISLKLADGLSLCHVGAHKRKSGRSAYEYV